VSYLFVNTFVRMEHVRNGPTPNLTVQVTGIQWAWTYKYANGKTSNTSLVIPVGQVVRLQVTSRDVLHAFWVPRLGGQVYAIPGQMNHGWIQADKPGPYFGQCNELCGLNHYAMDIQVDAVTAQQFQDYLAGKFIPGVGAPVGERVTNGTPVTTVGENDQLKFAPAEASVKVGDVIQWTNQGTAIHNVVFDNRAVPASDTMNGGDKYQLKFLKPGTYHYVCTFHVASGMNGTITVTGG
jgi:Heme/copper-type cytochrome/quinol oxidases, subunit 2